MASPTPFVERVRLVLDCDMIKLAEICQIDMLLCANLCMNARDQQLGDHDAVYERLLQYVDERIASGLAIRKELQRKLTKDRTARILQRERVQKR